MQPLLELFPMSRAQDSILFGLSFVNVPQFWTSVFPEADFAYVPWCEDSPNRKGKMMRFRQLMVSRHARQALIGAGLFTEKVFLGVCSVASPEEGIEILDQSHVPVPPMCTAEELADLRSRKRSLFAVQICGDGTVDHQISSFDGSANPVPDFGVGPVPDATAFALIR